MKMKSVMTHSFSRVPKADIPRSVFDRSHGYKTTFDGGKIVPIYVDEALPGDTFNLRMNAFARLATPLKPIMDNLHLETFFFAVPIRLIWSNWEKFNGAETDPGDSNSFTVPTMTAPGAGGVALGDLGDYMGIPTEINSLVFNSLHHRAYNLIWNEWFRDQNLQTSIVVDIDNGPDTYTDYIVKSRGKRHDYFTSCLPWPQKSDSAVELPAGAGTAPVSRVSNATYWTCYNSGTDTLSSNTAMTVDTSPVGAICDGGGTTNFSLDPGSGNLVADLSSATAATINEIREAFQLQKLYERDARGGTRYAEIIRSHFGVTSDDARLQRPEYLGGGSTPINVHPVANTSEDATQKLGDLAGFGTASISGHGFSKSFTEHCVILGLANVRADLTYQEGLPRMFSRQSREDFYWPALAQIGEQAVLDGEIFADGTANDDGVFGYQERYAEYRYKPSQITGQFRSNCATPLDMWHLSEEFGSLPTLGDTFITDAPPIDRCIAVPAEPHMLFDAYFSLKCARPMPVFGVPGNLDRF